MARGRRPAGDGRRLGPRRAPHLPSGRQAALGRRPSPRSCPARCRPSGRSRRRGGSLRRWPRRCRTVRARAAKPRALRLMPLARYAAPARSGRHRGALITPFWHLGASAKALRRLPERRHRRRHRARRARRLSLGEHAKRYTTLGMATDQGKTSSVNGLAILADATGRTIAQTGTTAFRPPFTPVAIGAHCRPRARQGLSPRHATRRRTTGRSSRARCSSRSARGIARSGIREPGERDWLESVNREARAVRAARRRLRCVDARQDRGHRPRRRPPARFRLCQRHLGA